MLFREVGGLYSVLQPEQYGAERGRIRLRREMRETARICGLIRQDRAGKDTPDLTYKEEVAGSSPASPTTRSGLGKPFWWRIVRIADAGSRSKASPR